MSGTAIASLQGIVQSFAEGIAKRFKTSVKWVDLYAEHEDMKNNQRYRLEITVNNAQYGTVSQSTLKPSFIYQQASSNDSPLPSTMQVSKTETTTSTFTWSLEEGLTLGAKQQAEAKADLPLLAGAEVQISFTEELSFSSIQTTTDTKTETWTINETVTLAPKMETNATWVINQSQVTCPYTIDISMSGYVAIWFKDKIEYNGPSGGSHWLWFIPVGTVAQSVNNPNFTSTDQGAKYSCVGAFTGVGATTASLSIVTYPLGTVIPPQGTPSVESISSELVRTDISKVPLLPLSRGTQSAASAKNFAAPDRPVGVE